MSSGNFIVQTYEASFGTFFMPCRVQPETLLLTNGTEANNGATNAINLSLFARARKGNSEYGVGMRSITISWDGAPPTDYSGDSLTVPVLTQAAFDSYTIGSAVTYLDTAATVVGRKPETVR